MSDVFGPFRTDKGAEVVAFREPFPHIEVDPDLRGGDPVVAESRVPYHLVASLVRDGVPPDAIREIYPAVDADDARARCEWRTMWSGDPAPPEVTPHCAYLLTRTSLSRCWTRCGMCCSATPNHRVDRLLRRYLEPR